MDGYDISKVWNRLHLSVDSLQFPNIQKETIDTKEDIKFSVASQSAPNKNL